MVNLPVVFDPSQDTLFEILHTILLGDAKYTWYDLHHNWTPVQQDIFTIRLQSTNLDGLRVPPIRAAYMMQYRNGLIGKHFKTLMQTTIFHIHDIVTPNQFTLVRALGELGPILWTAVIDDMEEYLADLQILIDNLLDASANIDPSKILIKLKLHVLLHIVQKIRRRGPGVRFSFNTVFRLCSVLSNHQAPSCDIAFKFADLDRVKHILSGGFWLQDAVWVRAGKDVNRILRNTPIIQRHLGWAPPPTYIPGLVQPVAQKKQNNLPALSRAETLLEGAANPFSIAIDPTTSWTPALNVTTVSGDTGKIGSWAVFRIKDVVILTTYFFAPENISQLPVLGRIEILLLPKGGKAAEGLLVIDRYDVGEALHRTTTHGAGYNGGPLKCYSVCLQCSARLPRACGCDASGVTRQMQERQESDMLVHSIVHSNDTQFVVNMHAFHNARLLRKVFQLRSPSPAACTRSRKRHDELAVELAVQQKAKRAETQRKVAATREKKKVDKAAHEKQANPMGMDEESEDESERRGEKRARVD
ncbi:hypothetical protein B0H10DRAFT_2441666 [Mycena sp. CBHHK59/15]|nr:hypothetical protein B0H10DRAFT_2441666 [Mycena sp. CBHHK59/15]